MKRILLLLLLVFGIGNAFGQVTLAKFQFENNLNADAGSIGSPVLTASATVNYYGGVTGNAGSFTSAGGKYFDVVMSTTGYSSIQVSFAGRSSANSTSWVVTGDPTGGTVFSAVTSLSCPNGSFGSLADTNIGNLYNNKSSIRLRITATGSTSATLRLDDFVIKGVLASPTTTVSATTLSNFTYVVGNGPSAFQSFNVSGSNLTANLVVTPPTNYEISQTSGGTYSSSAIDLTPTSGSVASTPIYVKLKAGLTVGNYNSETISVASTGVAAKTVTLSGSVTAPAPKMVVKGNSVIIVSGDTTPSLTDATDFGSTPINTTVTKTYTIENTGSSDLILPTTNPIILGNGSTGFTYTEPLLHTIPSGGNTTFTVSFNNATPGVFDDSILIASNDNNVSSTYTFSIKATATDIPINPSGTISGMTPACTSTVLTYTGTIPADETYYWQNSVTGTSQAQNATSTYSVAASGNYYVRAYKNGAWSTGTSTGYAVVINTPVAVTASPVSISRVIPATANFTVTATGTALAYQWQVSVDNGTNWTNVSGGTGATTASYTTVATDEGMNRNQYRCVVANSCGTVQSNAATLSLTNASPNNGLNLNSKVCYGNTSIDLSWTASTTSGAVSYIVFAKNDNTIPFVSPATLAGNAVDYVANNDFSLATTHANLGKAVYKGNGTSVTITGLVLGASYNFKVVAYIGETQTGWAAGITTNNTTSSWILANAIAKVPEVTNVAATMAPTSSSVSWNVVPSSAGCYEYMVVANLGAVTLLPSGDGSAYTANSIYAGNNQVIYKGTGNSVSVTGLSEDASYCYKVFVRKGNEWSEGASFCRTTGFNYCESYSTTDSYVAGIKGVNFNDIDTNDAASQNVTYTDNTNLQTDLVIGESYSLTVKVSSGGTATVYTKAWIDWNRNGIFDSNEAYELGSVITGTPATNMSTLPVYTINVPLGASLGLTRMRITTQYKSGETYATPCKQGDFSGEVEDYTIKIVRPSGAEIAVKGGNPGQVIPSGTTVANGLNGTLFASATIGSTPQEKEYTIENSGLSELLLNGTPSVSLLGTNPGDFTITQYPATSVASVGSTTFKIAFTPLQAGIKTAIVSIANNDDTGNENPYTFLIQGTATCTAITHSFSPSSGPVGTEVTIKATSGNLTGASVSFNGIAATNVVSVSPTEIKVIVPAGASTGVLLIENGQGCAVTSNFIVIKETLAGCEGNSETTSPTELFISQVTDSGTGDLTYIELYNGTASAINLASGLYGLSISNNGNAGYTSVGSLTGIIASGDTFVVAIGASTLPCNDGVRVGGNPNGFADLVFLGAGVNFSNGSNNNLGHDCITLSKNGTPLDRWGVHQDQTWASSLNLGGKGANFIRKNTGILPTINYTNNDWIIADWGDTCDDADYSDVGSHDFSFGLSPTIITQPTFAEQCGGTALTVEASEGFAGGHELAYQWFVNVPGQTTWTAVTNGGAYNGATGATLTIASLVGLNGYQYYVQVRENAVTCYTASNAVSISSTHDTVTWDGNAWSGTPDITKDAIINGFYNTEISGSLNVRSLVNNSTVNIASNTYVKIEYGLVNNDIFEIKDSGSLVQVCDMAINSGNAIKVERLSKPMYRFDYTYWSSPVTPQTLGNLSPLTAADKYFYWDSNSQDWTNILKTAQMQKGIGYIVRAPQNFSSNPLVNTIFTGNFNGLPNNGVIEVPVAGGNDPLNNKWNLLGNPYPSAIHADLLLDDTYNPGLEGTVYVWTHNTPLDPEPNQDGLFEYAENDYAVYNALGGTATAPGAAVYEGYIASGQGFFVKGIDANSDAVFNNSMRIVDKNEQFLRNSNTASGRSRIWLNIRDARNGFRQMLVGYVSGATNELDRKFDGGVFGGNVVTLYSIASETKLTIQGRALPFDTSDIVDLGYKNTTAGTLRISLDDFDGVFANQNIYLEDKALNIIHNLKEGDYSFASEAGTFDTRFVLRYTNETLSNPDFSGNANNVIVFAKDKGILVKSSKETIQGIAVYDLLGRVIYSNSKVNANELHVNDVPANVQVLVVKVTLENGVQTSKKIIIK